MTTVRWLIAALLMCAVTPSPTVRADEKTAPKEDEQQKRLAKYQAELLGKWETTVIDDQKKGWKYTLHFGDDGTGTRSVSGNKVVGFDNFFYTTMDLRRVGFAIIATGAAFPEDGNVIQFTFLEGQLVLLGGTDSRGVSLKGKWKRVLDKDK